MRRPLPTLVLSLTGFASPLLAQGSASAFDFSIPNIMRGPEIVGREPERVRFTADEKWIYFSWLPPGSDWREQLQPYRVRAVAGATPERVTLAHMDTVGPLLQRGDPSPDRKLRAVEWDGDIFVVDLKAGTSRRLTQTVARERDPHFDVAGRRVLFVRDDNVFALGVNGGMEEQLTDIRAGPEPKDSAAAKGQRGALEAEQRELFDAVRDKLRADSIAKALKKEHDSLRVRTLYLGKDEKVAALAVSPTGRALLIQTRIPSADKSRQTDIPEFVTKSGYTEELKVRDKVGDVQDGGRVAFIGLPRGTVKWLALTPDDTTHAPGFVALLGWNDAGTRALVEAVSYDWKTRYLYTVSADSGALNAVDVLRDTAWVDGPAFGQGGWLRGDNFWFVSEADGYAHLYTMGATGTGRRQLTSGKWEVNDVELSTDRRWFYLHTSEESPYERQFYRMPVAGGARERLTTLKGGHTVIVSPSERLLADLYSTANRPPELYLMANRAGAAESQLTVSPTAEWLSFHWIVPEIVQIRASDGAMVPARLYRPADMGAQPNGAGVIFVHGAGYLHNVHDYWSSYFREYMFNQYLASKGYVVLDADYRGSAGYGRDWRVAIYRHMGGRDLQDEVDASRYLRQTFGIPPERVGMYGGSYGGFMTLMALFTEGSYFGAGAALRSVTDWGHYNHWYTSRILNLPDKDSIAYRQSSPIYFAQGLNKPLLMAHGMVDQNVHYQDIVRLEQRLIELGKTNWELASYPVEDHGFVRPSSWADEYRRIYELFEANLRSPVKAAAGSR